MLWLLLRGLGYPGGTEDYFWAAETPREPMRLDPIEVAGNLQIKRVVALVREWDAAKRLLRILYDRTMLCEGPKGILACAEASLDVRTRGGRTEHTCKRYREHLRQLEDAGVIERCAMESVKAFGSYFSVAKTPTTDRAIFNGSRLKPLFCAPPPTGLADIASICRRFAQFVEQHETFYGFILDIRHCFHQMSVSPELSAYFGLACGEEYFRFVVLPMGWTYSPVVAQACGWCLLAGREGNQEALFEEDFLTDEQLPSFLTTLKVDGFAVLYYDNYFVITSDAVTTEKLRRRLCGNMSKCGKMPLDKTVKEIRTFSHKTLKKNPLNLLGCEYAVVPKRGRDGERLTLRWRIQPDKVPKEKTWNSAGSLRTQLQKLGKALHSLVMSIKPLGASALGEAILDMMSHVGKKAAETSWDELWMPEEKHGRVLEDALKYLQLNDWMYFESAPVPGHLVVSDASDAGYGWFVVRISPPQLLAARSRSWGLSMRNQHIFRKEGFAALSAIVFARKLTGARGLTVVVDNTAVAGALKRQYSPTLNRWLGWFGERWRTFGERRSPKYSKILQNFGIRFGTKLFGIRFYEYLFCIPKFRIPKVIPKVIPKNVLQ